jgi:hypothetical protein
MSTRRFFLNFLAVLILGAVLFGLVAIIVDERLSRQRSENESSVIPVQNVPSGAKMKERP